MITVFLAIFFVVVVLLLTVRLIKSSLFLREDPVSRLTTDNRHLRDVISAQGVRFVEMSNALDRARQARCNHETPMPDVRYIKQQHTINNQGQRINQLLAVIDRLMAERFELAIPEGETVPISHEALHEELERLGIPLGPVYEEDK